MTAGAVDPPIVFRAPRPQDLATVVAIYNEGVLDRNATADLEPVTVEQRRAWFAEHLEGRFPLIIAEAGGAVLGWASVSPYHTRCAYSSTVEVSVYVRRHVRGAGIGRALLAEIAARAREAGFRRLIAHVFSHNAASNRLCSGGGFDRWGSLKGVTVIDGVERDVEIWGLAL